MERIKKYSDFYAFYLTEHSNRISRILHFVGTLLFFVLLSYFIITNQYNHFGFYQLLDMVLHGLDISSLKKTNQQLSNIHFGH